MSGRNKFAEVIAEAAAQNDCNVADPGAELYPDDNILGVKRNGKRPQNEIQAQAEAKQAFEEVAARVREKYDVAVIWTDPRVGRRRTAAEYKFWKMPVMGFVEFPATLDLGPTALAKKYGPSEPNFTVTKDTFRAPLSEPARKELGRLLRSRGYNLKLPTAFSIRDIQKAMKDERDRAAGVARFKPEIEIVGDTVFCDNKSFKMQATGSGKMRIRAGNGWLPVEALTAFLSGRPSDGRER